jgi:hypothetical protein
MTTITQIRAIRIRRIWVSVNDEMEDFPNVAKAAEWLSRNIPLVAHVTSFSPQGLRVTTFDGANLNIELYWSNLEGLFTHSISPSGQLYVCQTLLGHHFRNHDFSLPLAHTPTIPLSAMAFMPPTSQQPWPARIGLLLVGLIGLGLYFPKLRYKTNWVSLSPTHRGRPITIKNQKGQWHLIRKKQSLIAHPDLGQALLLAARIQFSEDFGKRVELPAL